MPTGELTRDLLQVLYFFAPAYAANVAPVLVRGHFQALARPMDGGRMLAGVRLLGDHKTWRGLLAGVVAGILTFAVQRELYDAGLLHRLALVDYGAMSIGLGLLMGLGAGLGDAAKSFAKRRVGIAPGGSWIGFDQLDFMVGAWLAVAPLSAPPLAPTLLALPIIFVATVLATTAGYWLNVKEAWI